MEEFWPLGDYGYRHRMVLVLGTVNTPRARQALLSTALMSERGCRPWARSAARTYVNVLPDKANAAKLLVSKDTTVLQNAAMGLRGVRISNDTIARLLKLMQSTDTHLRLLVVGVLGEDPGGQFASDKVTAIVRAIHDIPKMEKADQVQWHGSWTRAETHYRTYIGALAKTKNGRKSLVRQMERAKASKPVWRSLVLARAFGGDGAVKPEVRTILTDPDAGMFRAWAAEALGRIGAKGDLPLLQKTAKKDPMQRELGGHEPPLNKQLYHPVRQAAKRAIESIEVPTPPAPQEASTQPATP